MAFMRKRLVGGEILEVPVGKRFGYVQFLGEHREYGDAVLVSPELHDRQASFSSGFFSNGYVAFYPAGVSVSQKLVEVVAQSSPPRLPKRFRRPKAERDGAVESWVIEGGWRKVVRQTLSDEERKLPIAEISNHEFLRERIAKGWTPEKDSR
ncbi:MAG TPA: hypothetical protein VFU13_17830 [Steroidobacteraceae bacterium]|nr:hypothetical protein [Steroidobacteraceae bacterium]